MLTGSVTLGEPPLDVIRQHGIDAVSFQAIKSAAHWWQDAVQPAGTGAFVPYVVSGRSWIAIGTPLTAAHQRAEAVRRFSAAAQASGHRAVFFGVEGLEPFAGCRTLRIGLQSVLKPAMWDEILRRSPRLREQLRRARAKGVEVRRVEPEELNDAELRAELERLRSEWLGSRAMEPLGFLVAVEPFHAPAEHLYFLAERNGQPVEFLSAVPIYARSGWLMEDMLRSASAPNGTTELVIDALMRTLRVDPYWITPGLTPLSGPTSWWMRATRLVTVPLYDFSGLQRFRARLKPARWDPVWLTWDRGTAAGVMIDVLRAFANDRMLRFAWRSLVRHPNGPPWTVAVPLVPWTLLLFALAVSGSSHALGFSTATLQAWVVFDAVLAWLLFRVARRPRRRGLIALAIAAGFDAVISIRHLFAVGFGTTAASILLRLIATAGPVIGTTGLLWALHRLRVARARSR
jgi:phosphatidylglycerol lysyltransferase